MIEAANITGVILCGGAGLRMHGCDKPLEIIAGQPMVAYVAARLTPQVCRVLISCNRNQPRYLQWCDEVVADEVAGGGPLQGILAALDRSETPWAFICPGDAPLLSTALVDVLAMAWSESSIDICIPHDGERTQHLFMLLRVSLRTALRAYLAGGGLSVHGWIHTLHVHCVDASALRDSFVNINTDQDLKGIAATVA